MRLRREADEPENADRLAPLVHEHDRERQQKDRARRDRDDGDREMETLEHDEGPRLRPMRLEPAWR